MPPGPLAQGSEVERWELDALSPHSLLFCVAQGSPGNGMFSLLWFSLFHFVCLDGDSALRTSHIYKLPVSFFTDIPRIFTEHYFRLALYKKTTHSPSNWGWGSNILCLANSEGKFFWRWPLPWLSACSKLGLWENVTILSKTWNRLNLVEIYIWPLELGSCVSYGQNPDFTEELL